jgi:hypothetical protein
VTASPLRTPEAGGTSPGRHAGGTSPVRTRFPGFVPVVILDDPNGHLRVIRRGPKLVEVIPRNAADYRRMQQREIGDAREAALENFTGQSSGLPARRCRPKDRKGSRSRRR